MRKDEIMQQYLDEQNLDIDDLPTDEEVITDEITSSEDESQPNEIESNDEDISENEELDQEDDSEEYEDGEEISENELLSNFGYVDGKLNLDGEETTFSDLDIEDQNYVLKQILLGQINPETTETEEGLNIPDEEKEAYSKFKELQSSGDLDRILSGQVVNEENDIPFEEMNDQEIFNYQYIISLPDETLEDMSEEELRELLQTEYEKDKESTTFSIRMNSLRAKFAEEDKLEKEAEFQRIQREQQAAYENDVNAFISQADQVQTILRSDVTDEDRQDIYSKVLEIDEKGDSQFVKDIFSSPESLMKAAYLFYKGDEMVDQMENYFAKTIQKLNKQRKGSVEDSGQGNVRLSAVHRSQDNNQGVSPQSNNTGNNKVVGKSASEIEARRLRNIKI